MKIVLFFLLITCSHVYGQNVLYRKVSEAEKQSRMRSYDLFRASARPGTRSSSPVLATKPLQLNEAAAQRILLENPRTLSFSVPADGDDLTLKLISRNIFSPDFRITDAWNMEVFSGSERYYGGIIEGDSSSLVSVTISEQGVSVYLYGERGNYHLGNTHEGGEYVLREAEDAGATLSCAARDTTTRPMAWDPAMNLRNSSTEFVNCNPVQVYFEVDYSLYLTAGTMEKAVYATKELFNKVSLVFENENVRLALQEIRIWDSPDPYRDLEGGMDVFYRFADETARDPSREISQLLTARFFREFGGVAYLVNYCSKEARVGLNANLNLSANYLGSIPHEIGHGLGVPHTHSCTWPGGPLDNCASPEGSCNPGPDVGKSGTIMSYCGGDRISNGFGVLPGNLLRKWVGQCWGSSEKPSRITSREVRANSALLSWTHPLIDNRFEVTYRTGIAGEWRTRTIADTMVVIDSLLPLTRYFWRVRTECSGYREGEFTTTNQPGYCLPDILDKNFCDRREYEPFYSISINNHSLHLFNPCYEPYYFSQSRLPDLAAGEHPIKIEYGTWYTAGVQVSVWIDFDGNGQFEEREKVYFTVERYMGPITGILKIPDSISPRTTRMRVAIINTGYSEEPIPDSPCGTYNSAKIYDYNVNLTQCGEEDRHPARNLQVREDTTGSVTLSWGHSSRNAFQVEYRQKYAERWISVPVNGTSLVLKGLAFAKTYEWRVKAACSEYEYAEFVSPKAEYCLPDYATDNQSDCNKLGTGIRRFSIENTSIDNTSDCSASGYTLYTQDSVTLQTGMIYKFTIQFIKSGYPMHASIWIDTNNDGFFSLDERVFLSSAAGFGSLSGQFTLPVNARSTRNTRMRVLTRHSIPPQASCFINGIAGETEDYIIHIESPCKDWMKGDFKVVAGLACGGGGITAETMLPENTPVELTISRWREDATFNLTTFVRNGKAVWVDLEEGIYTIRGATVNGCTTSFDHFVHFVPSYPPVFRVEVIRDPSMCDIPSGTLGFYNNLEDGTYGIQYTFNNETLRDSVEVRARWAVLRNLPAGTYHNFSMGNKDCILNSNIGAHLTEPRKPDVSAANSGPYYAGETIHLTATGGVDYAWTGPNGFSSDQQHPEIHLAKMGNGGEYTVTVRDAKNCRNTAATRVEIIPVLALETGEWVKVYPNPATDILSVQVPYSNESEATIYSVEGREVKRVRFKEKTEIEVRSLGVGNYILKVRNGKRAYVTKVSIL